jgi:protein TonB
MTRIVVAAALLVAGCGPAAIPPVEPLAVVPASAKVVPAVAARPASQPQKPVSMPDGTAAAAPAVAVRLASQPRNPVSMPDGTIVPVATGTCTGVYPEAAKRAGVEGVVILDLVVGEDGRTRDITVVRGPGHGLAEAAVLAARQCRFIPATRDGQPVPFRIRSYHVHFRVDY